MIFDQTEDGMIARLQAASDAGTLGYRFRKIASYGGEFDPGQGDDLIQGELRNLVRDFPAAWVVYGGGRFVEHGTGLYDAVEDFGVVVASRSLRNERASRRGDGSAPGSYQLIKDVIALLAGHDLGLAIDPLVPVDVRALWNRRVRGEMLSVFVISFRTGEKVEADHSGALDDFTHFHADWDVPTFGDHDTVPLDPGDADATDDVTPPGPQE